MDTVVATRPSACTEKRREERDATVQGAGEEIRDVEAEVHVGLDEGMEDGSLCGRKAIL